MLSRREWIKQGLWSIPAFHYGFGALLNRRMSDEDDKVTSPPTRPFVVELPVPPVAQPVATLNLTRRLNPAAAQLVTALNPLPQQNQVLGEAPRPPHQRWNEFLPQEFYAIRQREADHSFHPDLPLNKIWGFNGIFPGPTFQARYGIPIVVRFYNDLPADHVGFGVPQTSTHLHNAHVGSESDGFPADFFDSGLFKDHHYPNVLAGGDSREALGTLWYHDHRVDFTSQNVYKGLAGFCLLFDELDSGDETDPNPQAFRLPSGEFDIPLLFADKGFTQNGEVFFDVFNFDGFLGDKFTVNGVIQPFLKVARRKYRFRLLDAGPSRFYEFFLSSGQPFILIANDGNLLPAPLIVQSVRLGVANRMDVIVDFSNYRIGDQILLLNRLEQVDGRGPTGKLLSPGTPILRFDVDRDAPDPSQVPAAMRPLPEIDLAQVATIRRWEFKRDQGAWSVNGKFFNANEVRATPKQGTAEIWVLKNGGAGWSHPIHIHLEEFQILSRNGHRPAPHEVARKDVVELGPGDEVRVFMRFRDFLGKYPAHCHNTVHEDHAVMFRWDVVP